MSSALYVPRSRLDPEGVFCRVLSEAAFRPYGQVLAVAPDRVRNNHVAKLVNLRPTAELNVALVKAEAAPALLRVREMERHPFSAQSFLPLEESRYLVVVALDDGRGAPDLGTLAAFTAQGPYGINYDPGVWHTGMQTIAAPGIFALLVHEDGSPDDCHFQAVPEFCVAVTPRDQQAEVITQ